METKTLDWRNEFKDWSSLDWFIFEWCIFDSHFVFKSINVELNEESKSWNPYCLLLKRQREMKLLALVQAKIAFGSFINDFTNSTSGPDLNFTMDHSLWSIVYGTILSCHESWVVPKFRFVFFNSRFYFWLVICFEHEIG